MFRRINKTRKYQAPCAAVTDMVLENNFCATVRFLIDVEETVNMNAASEEERAAEYFEDIIS